jgi:putative transposase
MTNHVHLLFKVGQDDTLSKTMHWVSTVFSRKFNRASGRHGHLWEGRFRSTIVEEESYFLRCMAYVDLNPVRARIVKSPLDYRWCSHKALKDEDHAELDLHPLYFEAGPDARLRYRHYMELVNQEAQRPLVSLANEYFVGSRRFVNRMARKFGLDSDHFMVHKRLASGIEFVGPRRGGKGVTLSMPVVSS